MDFEMWTLKCAIISEFHVHVTSLQLQCFPLTSHNNIFWILQPVNKMTIFIYLYYNYKYKFMLMMHNCKGHYGAMWHYGFATMVDIMT